MVKIAINGFGRIGRAALKIALERPDTEVVAVNDLTDAKMLGHLLSFDSVYGRYEKEVSAGEGGFAIDGTEVAVFAEPDPLKLPWKELGVDVVLECTGAFLDAKKCSPHLEAGAKKVIISAPPKDETKIFCMGCNEQKYNPEADHIISNGSCTTNCVTPVLKILNDELGIDKALMSTIHSYTTTQNLVDGPNKDMLRARAAALNIVPSTTGAANAVSQVLPELKGKFDGMSYRVPTPCVSVVDLVVKLRQSVTIEKVNSIFIAATKTEIGKFFAVESKPLVSSDYIKTSHSSIVDLTQTMVLGGDMAKVVSWYDNEWGYTERLIDMAEFIMAQK